MMIKGSRKQFKINKGFTLLEVLISVLLIALVATAALALHFSSLKLTFLASMRTQGYQLARQGIQVVEEMNRNNQYFFNPAQAGKLNKDCAVYQTTDSIWDLSCTPTPDMTKMWVDLADAKYLRIVRLDQGKPPDGLPLGIAPNDYIKVSVLICWDEQAGNLQTCLEREKNYLETKTYLTKTSP